MTNDWASAKACIESGSFLEARNEVLHFLHTQCSLDKVSNGLRLIYTDIPHYMQYKAICVPEVLVRESD